ncbi:MAG: guanylate kinase [Candidatus Marinimicrobia bacterium]|nr:guanylate kinase [Candidatus Neomarinimicrobiota bacterium]MCH7858632.1 guanylate kinase [Candidatus Neomarinimicrobiota bacterium]
MSRGRLVVISAPSGAGKTTICRRLERDHPEWRFSVSGTTRPQRDHETNGKDYYFLTDDQFDEKVSKGEFLEWEWVHGYRYGTLHQALEEALANGETLLLDVDVKGGVNIKQQFSGDTIAIFIDPPDMETLAARLKRRGTEDPAIIKQRLARLPQELAYKQDYDHVVVNDNLETAINEVEAILKEVE